MSLSSPSLVPLIQHWETYAAECAAASTAPELASFAGWLARQVGSGPPLASPAVAPPHEAQYQQVRLADKVAILIWRLSRFMRLSFKHHFEDTPLQSIDEFSLLAGTHFLQEPTKNQLFQYNLLETTTGLQMLARLLRQGLVSENADPADRRLKRVRLTPAGRAVYERGCQQMDHISDDLLLVLPPADLQQLEGLLLRLNHYHTKPS